MGLFKFSSQSVMGLELAQYIGSFQLLRIDIGNLTHLDLQV